MKAEKASTFSLPRKIADQRTMAKPRIGITSGDINGIGPEIALKSVLAPSIRKVCLPILVGSIDTFACTAHKLRRKIHFVEVESAAAKPRGGDMPVINTLPYRIPVVKFGVAAEEGGRYAGEAITRAAQLCMSGDLDGMVTAPVSKTAMAMAGYRYPGQTEMLAQLSKSKHVVMMLVAGRFRIGLATVHLPIKEISKALSIHRLVDTADLMHQSLRHDFAIRRPKIALLGLNPHAGENGMIGSEEREIILPAVKTLLRRHIDVSGPFPADGFFGTHSYKQYDAVLAMYHDQGLIPLKMVGFSRGVNYSAGLRIVRTSPDHGTAFDIAGKGIADPGSMVEAISLAAKIISYRHTSRS